MINLRGRLKPYCGLSINRIEVLREKILNEKKECMHVNMDGTPTLLFICNFIKENCKLLHFTYYLL